MTKPAYHYHKSDFSEFIRNNCRDSRTGLTVSDIDYVFRDYNKKLVMVVEEKVNASFIPYGEKETLRLVCNGLQHNTLGFRYCGAYILCLGNSILSDPIRIGKIGITDEVETVQVLPDALTAFLNFDLTWEKLRIDYAL